MKKPSTNRKKQKGKKKDAKAGKSGPAPMETAEAPVSPSVWRPGQDPIEVSKRITFT